jgi:hypothetical protein
MLERHAEKWDRFSAKMQRQTKELEQQADSMKRHFAIESGNWLIKVTDGSK